MWHIFNNQCKIQSLTCYLFWVAAPATLQTKIPTHPHSRATCFFLWSQLATATATLSNFCFNFYSISQKWIFWIKICFKLLKGSIFELQNCNIHLKKGHSNLHSLHYCEKLLKLQSHIASLKMHRTHAHCKFQQNGFAPAHRNLLPHIATRNLLLHIASHDLVKSGSR